MIAEMASKQEIPVSCVILILELEGSNDEKREIILQEIPENLNLVVLS